MRCVVGINRFPTDTARELDLVREMAVSFGADAGVVNDGFTSGGEGSVEMAEAVQRAVASGSDFAPLAPPGTPIRERIETIARRVYGADGVEFLPDCQKRIDWLTERGMGTLPSLHVEDSPVAFARPGPKGPPPGLHRSHTQRLSLCRGRLHRRARGDIQLMPGLGKEPAYTRIDIDAAGQITGLT